MAVADRYQELAYSLQRQRWANTVAPQQAARVQRVRTLGREGAPADAVPATMSPHLMVATLSVQPVTDPTAYGGRRFWEASKNQPAPTRFTGDLAAALSAALSGVQTKAEEERFCSGDRCEMKRPA